MSDTHSVTLLFSIASAGEMPDVLEAALSPARVEAAAASGTRAEAAADPARTEAAAEARAGARS